MLIMKQRMGKRLCEYIGITILAQIPFHDITNHDADHIADAHSIINGITTVIRI